MLPITTQNKTNKLCEQTLYLFFKNEVFMIFFSAVAASKRISIEINISISKIRMTL